MMRNQDLSHFWDLISLKYKTHPWHGISIGDEVPDEVQVFVEVVPTDTVKYEIDKASGYLKVDRPQKYSNYLPALYGFIPQTYCWERVADICRERTGRKTIIGDGDPLDICVLTERQITYGNIQVKAIPIGGFRMIDAGEADDKIIAIMKGDEVYQHWRDVGQLPETLISRLKHYFLTYKDMPGQLKPRCEITHIYGREEAHQLIRKSMEDYLEKFGNLEDQLNEILFKVFAGEKK